MTLHVRAFYFLVHFFAVLCSTTAKNDQSLGWNPLQRTRIAVALARGNFLLFLSQKTIEHSHVPKRQLNAYATNESTLRVRFFGRIQDWIFDPRSHGFVTTKETKNPEIDFFS